MNKGSVTDLNLYYGSRHILKHVNLEIRERTVMALMGPSGCGKSSFLRCINRMNDLAGDSRVEGQILVDGENVYDRGVDTSLLRKKVGMVFQQPVPFPMSIYDNVAYGPRAHGIRGRSRLEKIVVQALEDASLYGEVRDRLGRPAAGLSGGQKQRLCIARALAVSPGVLLMDEPTSALDPASTLKIEELIRKLGKKLTVVIVTHNIQQAMRLADDAALFLDGELVEWGSSGQIFLRPRDKRTRQYMAGRL